MKQNIFLTILLISLTVVFACGSGGGGGTDNLENNNLENNNDNDNNEEDIIVDDGKRYSLSGEINVFARNPENNMIGIVRIYNSNNGDSVVLQDDTTFIFSKKLKNKEVYNILISEQPEWEDCRIVNGSGTISNSDITNIKVICDDLASVPKYYSIGVNISNYNTDDNLRLNLSASNNYDEESVITGNGSFIFRKQIRDNSTFTLYTTRVGNSFYPYYQICNFEENDKNMITGKISGSDILDIKLDCFSYNVKIISLKRNGQISDGISKNPVISGDGKMIAFESIGTLIPSLSIYNKQNNIFVYNVETENLRLVSSNYYLNKNQANDKSEKVQISQNGQFIVFQSYATNLILNDTNDNSDVFVYDYSNGRLNLVSVNSDGVQSNGLSYSSSISTNSRYIKFYSTATNLDPNDTDDGSDIFIHDLETGETKLYEIGSIDAIFHSLLDSSNHEYSVMRDSIDGLTGVFVKDNLNSEIEYVSKSTDLNPKYFDGINPKISFDGKWIVFQSRNNPLVHIDTNFKPDIYLVPNPFLE